MPVKIRQMENEDWPAVSEIYKEGIETGNSTFQDKIPEWDEWDKGHLKICRFVAELDCKVVGWVALSPVSGRCVYAGVTEVSIYIAADHRGKKTGTRLLEELISESEKEGIWTLQAGIFPENKASLHIHQQAGFRIVGYREKIGKMHGVWRDTILLERRSKITGAN